MPADIDFLRKIRFSILNEKLLEQSKDSFVTSCKKMNAFFFNHALQNQRHNISQTSVATYHGVIIGFIALGTDILALEDLEKSKSNTQIKKIYGGRPMYPVIPAIKIGRLACHVDSQKKGLGEFLIAISIFKAIDLNIRGIACRALTLDAYKDKISYYNKLGFKNLEKEYIDENRENPEDTKTLWLDVLNKDVSPIKLMKQVYTTVKA